MRIVVADTGPLNYLVLIEAIQILPTLFGEVFAPQAVIEELTDPATPSPVRTWAAQAPEWLMIRPSPEEANGFDADRKLDSGEQAAIGLAVALKADLVLMDDRDGVAVARRMGFVATGTIGVLDLAARNGLLDLAEAFTRLKATGFYYRQGLLDGLLANREGKL